MELNNSPKILILEGVDKCGKSTVAELLKAQHGYPIIKGLRAKTPQELKDAGEKLLAEVEVQLKSGAKKVIVDRINNISEPIYNPLFKKAGDPVLFNQYCDVLMGLDTILMHLNEKYGIALYIFTLPPEEVVARMRKDGGPADDLEEEVLVGTKKFIEAYENLYTTLAMRLESEAPMWFNKVVLIDGGTLTPEQTAIAIEDAANDVPQSLTVHKLSEIVPLRKRPLQVAAIAPIGVPIRGNFALALAQNLDAEFMVDKWRNYKGYKILDNGAFELGKSISLSKLVKLANRINADELVLPDVFQDSEKTIKATYDALDYLEGKYPDRPFKLMAVPQGKTFEEWYECFKQFMADPRIDVIAVNRDSSRFFGKRYSVLKEIADDIKIDKAGKEIHLLGMGDNLSEIEYVNVEFPWVRSVDSSFMWILAKISAEQEHKIDINHHWNRQDMSEKINFRDTATKEEKDFYTEICEDIMNNWKVEV